MRGILCRLAAGGTTVVAAVGLAVTPAYALSWTITSPDPDFVGVNVTPNGFDGTKNVILVNHRNGVRFHCTTSIIKGTVPAWNDADGIGVLRITSQTFSTCPALGVTFTFTTGSSAADPSPVSVTETSYTPPQVDARIEGFAATWTGPGCTATMGGPLAPVNTPEATLTGYYDNSSHNLVLTGGGDLTVRSHSGCFGQMTTGDRLSMYVRYQMSPALTITSP
ncbi:hypothetical protein [Thermomonospora umbrina]|uniref:Uncharacterized protein n=1 Tax=Thermomonospora umbrina TaxID=111806 RepID=A0A3D9SMQ0_9ACTN|nr:hypothetical protein [Thermomonospora umbrina]REE97128.1 hypothetical protein DFJ69_2585 [Thermomonospora umbrina]